MQESEFIIRAALAEETNNGWVWLCGPAARTLESRVVVKISRPGDRRAIYTEVRKIDRNFLHRYNQAPRTDIDDGRDTIVMGEWYRTALAIRGTTKKDNATDRVALIVERAKLWGWRSLRAACHHPDLVVRLGTRLGLLGAWLGVLGVWLGLLGVFGMYGLGLVFGFGVLALGALGLWAGRGPPRPAVS
jgi:hypothetical protein